MKAVIEKGANDSDLVVIHDAARPAVPTADIDSVVTAAMFETYGAILAAPVADTLKQSTEHTVTNTSSADTVDNRSNTVSYIKATVDRREMWQAQTPQVFRVGELRRLLDYVAENQLAITDEASAFEYLDLPIRLVEGSRQNVKLTFPEDAILLAAILSAQAEN